MPKVSVIIPLHNAGSRLTTCLESLKKQSLTDFEVIIVSDCPTDGSDTIAKRFCQQDSRFIFIENEQNQHIGYSRNKGIAVANGDYITFSDHDDYHDVDFLLKMLTTAVKSKAEVVIGRPSTTLQQDETNIEHFPTEVFENIKDYILKDLLSKGSIHGRNNSLFNLVIGNFYRKDLIKNNSLQFVDTRQTTPEDQLFQLDAILSANSIAVVDEALYIHVNHNDNEGSKPSYINPTKRLSGIEKAREILEKHKKYDEYASYFLKGGCLQLILLMSNTIFHTPLKTLKTRSIIKSHPLTQELLPFAPESSKGVMAKQIRRLIVKLIK